MITRIQPYSINSKNYQPNFGAVIAHGHYVPVRRKGEVIPENIIPKIFTQIREIFFESFPKLDPEYAKVQNKKV